MIRRLFDVVRNCTGAALVEFSIVMPVLILLVLGIGQFGLAFYHYTLVVSAAAAGARQLSISRLDSNGYCDTENMIINASGGLGGIPGTSGGCPSLYGDFTITFAVNGSTCTASGSSSCTSALTTAYQAGGFPPEPASVTVKLTCTNNSILPASFVSLTGICPLQSTMQAPVQ
jgi:Flp pilus assembly protein TadG